MVPRYFFDLVDSKTVTDHGGQNLPDDETARDVARGLAKRLGREQPQLLNRNFAIIVSSQNGDQICSVPLDVRH